MPARTILLVGLPSIFVEIIDVPFVAFQVLVAALKLLASSRKKGVVEPKSARDEFVPGKEVPEPFGAVFQPPKLKLFFPSPGATGNLFAVGDSKTPIRSGINAEDAVFVFLSKVTVR